MAKCRISVDYTEKNKVFTSLVDQFTTDPIQAVPMYKAVISPDGRSFNNSFKAFVRKHYGKNVNSLYARDFENVAKYIHDYYIEHDKPIVEKLVADYSNSDSITNYGYNSEQDRDFAKRDVSNYIMIAAIEHINLQDGKQSDKDQLLKDVRTGFRDTITKRLCILSGKTRDDYFVEKVDNKGNKTYVKKKVTVEENGVSKVVYPFNEDLLEYFGKTNNVADRNLYATYKELIDTNTDEDGVTYSEKFFLEAYNANSARLSGCKIKINDEIDEHNAIDEANVETGDETSETQDTESTDDSLFTLNNHFGQYTDFNRHIDADLKLRLSLIPKLITGDKFNKDAPQYDKNNPLGEVDYMDLESVTSILYSEAINYISRDTMLESLERIAKTIDGCQGFAKLVQDLKEDTDYLFKFYQTFKKVVISKTQLIKRNETVDSIISNHKADRRFAFHNDLVTQIGTTALFADEDSLLYSLSKVTEYVTSDFNNATGNINPNGDITRIYNELENVFNALFPNLNFKSVKAYIVNTEIDGVVNPKRNIEFVVRKLKDILESTSVTKNNYVTRNREASQIEDPEEKLKKYTESYYSDKLLSYTHDLAEMLLPYTLVKSELNSLNVKGNLSSDVINDSWITNMKRILESKELLEKWGEQKCKSIQYRFSNILFEQKDKNGLIINKGIFRKNADGTYTPTEYAQDLIKITLFDGVKDDNSDNALLYQEMSYNDYVLTAFNKFLHIADDELNDSFKEHQHGSYFMRTPSDAPKNFIIGGFRYNTNDLLNIDAVERDNLLNSIANNPIFNVISNKAITEDWAVNNSKLKVTVDELIDVINGNSTIDNIAFYKNHQLKVTNAKGETQIALQIIDGDDEYGTIILSGKTLKSGNRSVLTNCKIEGVVTNDEVVYNRLIKNTFIEDAILNGKISRRINTGHRIYKQFLNVVKQECTNAGEALRYIFDTVVDEDGGVKVIVKDGKILYSEKLRDEDDHTKLSRKGQLALRDNYDCKRNKKDRTPVVIKDGKLVGKVFHSDRFTIGETNFMDVIFDAEKGCIDLLAESGDSSKYLHIDKDGNVILTKQQEQFIQDRIAEYINASIVNGYNKLKDIKSLINKDDFTIRNIEDFVLNYTLQFINYSDLFEGDSKCYKDTQTQLKRAKEWQASGIASALQDLRNYRIDGDPVDLTQQDENGNTVPMTHDFIKRGVNGGIQPVTVRLRNGWKAVTVENVITQTEWTKKDSPLYQLLKSTGLSEEKIDNLLSGYADTTVNDAQSYITFEEWIRRISAFGEFNKYKPLIDKIYDETQELTAEDISAFVQLQKNVYYDMYYDRERNVEFPRQIKNAEFVIIPRLVKGTELEKIYNLMQRLGIDQLNTVETSKASNNNVYKLWNEDGTIREDVMSDIENGTSNSDIMQFGSSTAETFSYNYLYRQQETPQHLNDTNKAGIQIVKKILDNIPTDSPLYSYKEDFYKNYVANIHYEYKRLLFELGIPLDENGHIKLTNEDGSLSISNMDFKVMMNKLRDEAVRQNLDSNTLAFLTLSENQMFGKYPTTDMPLYMSTISRKLENIAQSLINNRVTRQVLAGFHAGQLSNTGWTKYSNKDGQIQKSSKLKYHPYAYQENTTNKWISEEQYNNLSEEDKKRYTKKTASYVEVMMPASAFKFKRKKKDGTYKTKEELLKELQDSGLDEFIGYRIPTEGKQSIAIMKVTELIDDAYGSTIVVPDDWVGQTGSDFDIDSVYGIQKESYIDNNGHIKSRELKTPDQINELDYYKYINDYIFSTDYLPDGVKENINKHREYIRELKSNRLKTIIGEKSDIFNNLSEDSKALVIELKRRIDKGGNIKYTDKVERLLKSIKDKKLDIKHTDLKTYYNQVQNALYEAYSVQAETIAQEKDLLRKYEYLAKVVNLPSFEEFKQLPIEEQNTKEARSTQIVNDMMSILGAPESIEENISRSNFDDLTEARDEVMNAAVKNERANRSPYSFFDQAAFMYDAMSGARLKAKSVVRDTFCSVCNTVRPILKNDSTLDIVIDINETRKVKDKITGKTVEEKVYNIDDINAAFDANDITDLGRSKIKLHIKKFGWSNNNKNIVGKILTAYTSQTTAHILDAIKEGAIPNENDYTFNVFKMFPDLGLDYSIACSFIMQDAIRRICENDLANKSVYSETNYNPIHTTIKQIAIDMGFKIKESTQINTVLGILSESSDIKTLYKEIFGQSLNGKFSLDNAFTKQFYFYKNLQVARLKNTGVFADSEPNVEQKRLLYDLITVLQFNRLNDIANSIADTARVCNPDKFGAKQSLFATNKVFDDIATLIEDDRCPLIVNSGEKHIGFLQSIYPNIEQGLQTYIESSDTDSSTGGFISTYPTLNTFLKCATASSIVINRVLFQTQRPQFRAIVDDLESAFSRKDMKLTEEIARDYTNYILGYLYKRCSLFSKEIYYDAKDETFKLRDYTSDTTVDNAGKVKVVSVANKQSNELNRTYGFGRGENFAIPNRVAIVDENNQPTGRYRTIFKEFEVQDIFHPTQEEVSDFMKLTPAQKVVWISNHFKGEGIWNYLTVSLSNRYYKQGQQTINFRQDAANIETVLRSFRNCFDSTNPLVKAMAIDLIKYGFVTEKFTFGKSKVSKAIDCNSIKNDLVNGDTIVQGTGIVNELNREFIDLDTFLDDDFTSKVQELYVRSHSTMNQISKRKIAIVKKVKGDYIYEIREKRFGVIQFTTEDLENDDTKEILLKYNICNEDKKGNLTPNKYVKLNQPYKKVKKLIKDEFGNVITDFDEDNYIWEYNPEYVLYKIVRTDSGEIYLYPLNKLEEGENEEWSANSTNNKYYSSEFYETYINYLSSSNIQEENKQKQIQNNFTKWLKEQGKTLADYRYKRPSVVKSTNTYKKLDLTKPPVGKESQYQFILDRLQHYYSQTTVNDDGVITGDGKHTRKTYIPINYSLDQYLRSYFPWKNEDNKGYRQYTTVALDINGTRRPVLFAVRKVWFGAESNVMRKYNSNPSIIDIQNNFAGNSVSALEFTPITTTANQVEENTETQVMFSSIIENSEELSSDLSTSMKLVKDDDAAVAELRKAKREFDAEGDDTAKDSTSAVRLVAKTLTTSYNHIINNLSHFTDVNGEPVSMTDPRVMDIIKNNPALRNKYIETILLAKSIVERYEHYNKLDPVADNDLLQSYINTIKNIVINLNNNIDIENAYRTLATNYLVSESTNPDLNGIDGEALYSIFAGYHRSTMLGAMIDNLQDSANPIVQIITKKVTTDLNTQQMLAQKRVEEMRADYKKILDEAAAHGMTVDMSKIIDDKGYRHKPYNDQFRAIVDDFINNLKNIKEQYGVNSWQYKEASLRFDEFKCKYIARKYNVDYYKERNAIIARMLYPKKEDAIFAQDPDAPAKETRAEYVAFRPILDKYLKLVGEQRELYNYLKGNPNDQATKDKLKEIKDEIKQLTSNYITDDKGRVVERKSRIHYQNAVGSNDAKLLEQYHIQSKEAVAALQSYISSLRDLNDKWFKYQDAFGFDEELKKNLDIITSYREKNPDATEYDLRKNEQYAKAIEWLDLNATFDYSSEFWKEFNRVNDLLHGKKNKGSRAAGYRKLIKDIAEKHDAYDGARQIDATLFTDEEIARIKKEEEAYQEYNANTGSNAGRLISNGNPNKEIYTQEYYRHLRAGGSLNPEYANAVRAINEILSKHYDSRAKHIRIEELSLEEARYLVDFYDTLRGTKKHVFNEFEADNSKQVAKFMSSHVEQMFNYDLLDKDKFNIEHLKDSKGKEWYDTMMNLLYETVVDDEGDVVTKPNRYLYSYTKLSSKLKDSVRKKYLDGERTEQVAKLHDLVEFVPTRYYYSKRKEMQTKSAKEYQTWFNNNHVYDHYTGEFVPLSCWTTMQPKEDYFGDAAKGAWKANELNRERKPYMGEAETEHKVVKDRATGIPKLSVSTYKRPYTLNVKFNDNGDPLLDDEGNYESDYNESYNIEDNYIQGSNNGEYDSNVKLNEYEQKTLDLINDILHTLATTKQSRRYLATGRMPSFVKAGKLSKKDIAKELGKFVGTYDTTAGYGKWFDDSEINYMGDDIGTMPMTTLLHSKESPKDKPIAPTKPNSENYSSPEEYSNAVKQYNKDKEIYEEKLKEYKDKEEEVHQSLLDRDWWKVMEEFVTRASRYNAIQNNKLLLYYGENLLKDFATYTQKTGRKYLNSKLTANGERIYTKTIDNRLYEQYINWCRRVIYGQFKMPEGKFTNAANFIQSYVSSVYMTLNPRGGFANITQGEIQIFTEAFGQKYFNSKDWAKGHRDWVESLVSIASGIYSDKSTSVEDAIFKFMNIIDFDEFNGVVSVPDINKNLERARNALYITQSAGEHMMQNSTMLAMMYSHRIYKDPILGRYVAGTINDYTRNIQLEAFYKAFDENSEERKAFNEFRKTIHKDANKEIKYARYRKDYVTTFLSTYGERSTRNSRIKHFKEVYENLKEAKEKEFEQAPTLRSQLKLGDNGTLDFQDDSVMATELTMEERYHILGEFKQKMIDVNHYIHGNYDKLSAAQLEKHWFGGFIMQYHKHLYPGFMKHYRTQGYWNESRGNVEKGYYVSLYDFIKLNLESIKSDGNLTEEQYEATKGVQNIFRYITSFVSNARLIYSTLPEYEKANIRRAHVEMFGYAAAIGMAVLAKGLQNADSDDDGIDDWLANYLIYESDRMGSEALMYGVGAYSEGKKLWSSPIAATSRVADLMNVMNETAHYLMLGDDYDPTFHQGRFAGKDRRLVYLKRSIPVYRNVDSMFNIKDDNKYYKLGSNGVNWFSKKVYNEDEE